MKYHDAAKKLAPLRKQLEELRQEMVKVRRAAEPQPMADYNFTRADGKTASWSDLFGAKSDLIVIHNMGRGCRYCTLWADGFNGVYDQLASRDMCSRVRSNGGAGCFTWAASRPLPGAIDSGLRLARR